MTLASTPYGILPGCRCEETGGQAGAREGSVVSGATMRFWKGEAEESGGGRRVEACVVEVDCFLFILVGKSRLKS